MGLLTHFREHAPQYWLLVGLLLIVLGTFFGLQIARPYIFVGIGGGVFCGLAALRSFAKRSGPPQIEHPDAGLDQTCELNYRPDKS